jgi:hypothetical protein
MPFPGLEIEVKPLGKSPTFAESAKMGHPRHGELSRVSVLHPKPGSADGAEARYSATQLLWKAQSNADERSYYLDSAAGSAIVFLYSSASVATQIISIMSVVGGCNLSTSLSMGTHGFV